MTDTDRLAALLYDVSVEAYQQRRWAQAPWPMDLYEWVADRLREHGVTVQPAAPAEGLDDMCPNCVTPWKCNGPHIPEAS